MELINTKTRALLDESCMLTLPTSNDENKLVMTWNMIRPPLNYHDRNRHIKPLIVFFVCISGLVASRNIEAKL